MKEEDKMSKEYCVFYHRDRGTEKEERYRNKMLYDYAQNFESKENAYKFAYKNMPAIVMKQITGPTEAKEYLVAARFEGKYKHYDYGGGSDPLTNYDIIRCEKSKLEKIVGKFSKEDNLEEIMIGIEEKLF